jgi:phosphatidate cytidylyltransferase
VADEPHGRDASPRPLGAPPPRGTSDLQQRILIGVPAAAVALFFVIIGEAPFTAFLAVFGLIGLHELYAMYPQAHASRLAGFLALVGLLVAADLGGRADILLVLALAVPVTFGLTLLQPRGGAPAIAVTLLGVSWIGVALAHAVLLRELPDGRDLIINVMVGTFVGDTGAYLGGRMFGRTPLAPTISPNKTVEGLAIGVVAAIAGVWFAGLYEDWLSGTDALILGAAIALVAPIGDLFESYLKRDAGTKDTGVVFGAHGGALDRLDALFFSIVAAYYVWQALV